MARLLCAVMLGLSVYAEGTALANGRFPRAQQIVSVPGDPQRVFLRATFGVVASFDGGGSWRWLCEEAIGFSGTWDPPIAATRDGRLWMGLEHGLSFTTDACNVQRVPALEGELVSDVSADGDDVVLATSTPNKPAAVWRVSHGVARKLGSGLESYYLDTIDASGKRLYATGIHVGQKIAPHIFRSDDGGATFHELHPTFPTEGRLYLAAIDPKSSDRILVRQLSARGSDLLLSEDAGATFRVALHMNGAMFGFAQSEDGQKVWAGSGVSDEGLSRSTDRGRTFTAVAKAPIFCLHSTPAKLFTCSNPFTLAAPGAERGYAIGVSTDAGDTIRPLIGFSDVLGPVACDAGAGAGCGKNWTSMHATLTTQTSAPSASAPPAVDAAPSAAPSAAPAARSSCGCRTGPSPSSAGWLLLAAALALIVRIRTFGSERSPHLDRRDPSIEPPPRRPRAAKSAQSRRSALAPRLQTEWHALPPPAHRARCARRRMR